MNGGYDWVAEYGGALQEIIEENIDFVWCGHEIDKELALELGQLEEDELVDKVMADD